ncbi:hypothetical protein KHA80_16995 [Anaerobacillus sp. HL2]|nr:hypothetical protein KHA80_16995 [Anaerobacillus sp. HL2]
MKQASFCRLDSTSVALLSYLIIPDIGHDHMDILGPTIEAVAKEKAGIIKRGTLLYLVQTNEEAIEVIKKQANNLSSPLYQLNEDFRCEHHQRFFTFQSEALTLEDLQTRCSRKHQQKNASLALATLIM